jgi:hypothetical protein
MLAEQIPTILPTPPPGDSVEATRIYSARRCRALKFPAQIMLVAA